jgi:glutamine synthetase
MEISEDTDAKERVLKIVQEQDVKFVEMQFSDILGTVKSVSIPTESLEDAMEGGVSIDGSSILGYATAEESDLKGMPILESLQIYPWTCGTESKTARLLCKIYDHNGNRFEGDPRYALERVAKRAEEMGYVFNVGPELEFFLMRREDIDNGILRPSDKGRYFDLMPVDRGEGVRKQIMTNFNRMGFRIEASHHEVAPGQQEIKLRYGDALTVADRVMDMKFGVRTIARLNDLHATFIPKPFRDENGNAMHVHQSLATINGENAFDDPDGEYGLSNIALMYIGGLMAHAKETCGILASHINSYKRLIPGYEAPCQISWAHRSRSALLRVPSGRGRGTRVEHRNPDPAGNPYLQFAAMLAAGLDGIEKGVIPPEPLDKDVYSMSKMEREQIGLESLPDNLGEALDHMAGSNFMRDTLGEHILEHYIYIKRKEWIEYTRQVTPWELERYITTV